MTSQAIIKTKLKLIVFCTTNFSNGVLLESKKTTLKAQLLLL